MGLQSLEIRQNGCSPFPDKISYCLPFKYLAYLCSNLALTDNLTLLLIQSSYRVWESWKGLCGFQFFVQQFLLIQIFVQLSKLFSKPQNGALTRSQGATQARGDSRGWKQLTCEAKIKLRADLECYTWVARRGEDDPRVVTNLLSCWWQYEDLALSVNKPLLSYNYNRKLDVLSRETKRKK